MTTIVKFMAMLHPSYRHEGDADKDGTLNQCSSSSTGSCMTKTDRRGFFGALALVAMLFVSPNSSNSDPGIPMIKPTQEMLFSPCERKKVTEDGALFAADCFDFDKKNPTRRDLFNQVTGGFARRYDENRQLRKEGDLQSFLDDGDLVIEGTGSFSYVRIRATRATGYCEVQFNELALAGPSDATNFASIKQAFLENADAYARAYRSYTLTYGNLVADGSRFAASYSRNWQQSLWYANRYGVDIESVQQRISAAMLRKI